MSILPPATVMPCMKMSFPPNRLDSSSPSTKILFSTIRFIFVFFKVSLHPYIFEICTIRTYYGRQVSLGLLSFRFYLVVAF